MKMFNRINNTEGTSELDNSQKIQPLRNRHLTKFSTKTTKTNWYLPEYSFPWLRSAKIRVARLKGMKRSNRSPIRNRCIRPHPHGILTTKRPPPPAEHQERSLWSMVSICHGRLWAQIGFWQVGMEKFAVWCRSNGNSWQFGLKWHQKRKTAISTRQLHGNTKVTRLQKVWHQNLSSVMSRMRKSGWPNAKTKTRFSKNRIARN